MEVHQQFHYCPRCGSSEVEFSLARRMDCSSCGLQFYLNVAAAVGVILYRKDQVLLTVRQKDPGKGMLDLPGGFVDVGERAEDAAIREIREELAIELSSVHFAGSSANVYVFGGVTYHTCDLFFLAELPPSPIYLQESEIESIEMHSIHALPLERLAFESNRSIFARVKDEKLIPE